MLVLSYIKYPNMRKFPGEIILFIGMAEII